MTTPLLKIFNIIYKVKRFTRYDYYMHKPKRLLLQYTYQNENWIVFTKRSGVLKKV
jgi:hypothetical protein